MSQMNSMTIAGKLALRGRPLLRILPNKMVLPKGRTEPFWKLPVPCFMTKVFRSSYGEKLPTPLCMFKIDAHIQHWTPKLPKKSSLVRNLMFLILEFLEVSYIFICRKKREANWMLLERRERLWARVKPRRHIESMFLVKEKWRYVMMSPSTKMLPSGRLEIFLSQRKTKKKQQESRKNRRTMLKGRWIL